MQYAVLGRTGLRVSRLGFGTMRFPMKSDAEVDRDVTIPLLRRAFELGVNCFDSAVGYCSGDSQRVLGEALEDVRDQVVLSTKNPHYNKSDKATWWKNLEDSLRLLRTDHIDLYSFHSLNYEAFEEALAGEDGLYKEMLKARDQGLIRHIGHSFHGSNESLRKLIDTGLFESVILQYNLLDQRLEPEMAYAHERGMGVIVMGPVGGGRLGYPSERAAELVGQVKSTPELALRFVLSNESVTMALSGMTETKQVEENVATVSRVGKLTREDNRKIKAAVRERKELMGLYCTGCGYCMPCPEGVDIPANLEILNLERVFGLTQHAKGRYAGLPGKAAFCRLCGKCLERCPQKLDIPLRLGEAVAALDERAGSVAGWGELRKASPAEHGLLRLHMRCHLKNFTPRPQNVQVELNSHYEEQVHPARFRVNELKPYGRRHKDLEVLVRPPLETLTVDVLLKHDGTQLAEHLHYVVTTAARQKAHAFDPTARRKGALHVPSAIHPAHAAEKPLRGHSFDFVASYDDENLYVWADVEDDLRWPAREEARRRMRADNLCIFLDGRKSSELGRGGYRDGVMSLTVFVPAQDAAKPQVRTSNDSQVTVELARTPIGYRVDCAIPWRVFSRVKGTPGVIGFDVAINSYDSEGKEDVRLAWTGRTGQDRDAGGFGRLLLI
jgi:hypothetical protein